MNENETRESPNARRRRTALWLILATTVAALAAVGGVALLVNILERKQEARNPFYRVVNLTETTVDPEIWGKNFPFQYDGYRRTVDMVRTRHGGSEALPRTPSEADPRSIVAQSRLEEDPRLKRLWAGYPFAVDFREERGHAYMLEDQTFTGRQTAVQQPGTCLNCHASTYAAYRELGQGDLQRGFDALNRMPFQEARALLQHPVACIDCHEPTTLALRITRPAFIEGIRKVKALQGIKDYDVNQAATRQEMRSYVCGQCHVEYYFQGPEKRLVYPWDKGLKVDNMLDYYNEVKHKDWTHAESKADVLKAQHPEFEMFNQGVHARSGVACADCHMPYRREGALKVSDHHVRSPLLNINRACQTCHKWPEEELRARVYTIQDRTQHIRGLALNAVIDLISEIQSAGATLSPDQLAQARGFQRKAQFFLDYVEAENSMGFHAPQEAARILAESIDASRHGQMALRPPQARVPSGP